MIPETLNRTAGGPGDNRHGSLDEGVSAAVTCPSEDGTVLELLERMRAGDRAAAALFVTRYGSRIRRRIRGKLSPAMRRIFDSQDILSTLGRRLDLFVRSRRLEALNEGQLWALVFRMAENAVIDKARVFRRLRQVEEEDGEFAQQLAIRLRLAERDQSEGAEVEIRNVLNLLEDQIDREILSRWLMGMDHRGTAELVNLAPTAVRKRLQKIKAELHRRFVEENGR